MDTYEHVTDCSLAMNEKRDVAHGHREKTIVFGRGSSRPRFK